MRYFRIHLSQFVLIRGEIVESAIMILWWSMFGTEDEGAFASRLDNADFLFAMPALVSINL